MVKEKLIISSRIDENLFNEIERFTSKKGWTKSKLSRIAMQEHLFIHGTAVSYLVCSRVEFKFLLKCLDESQLKELALIGYQNIDKFRQYLIKNYFKLERAEPSQLGVKRNLSILLRYMFAPDGQNLFQEIKSIWNKKNLIIFGNHENGLNFSIYTKYLLVEFLEPFDYEFKKTDLKENRIIIEFNYSKPTSII